MIVFWIFLNTIQFVHAHVHTQTIRYYVRFVCRNAGIIYQTRLCPQGSYAVKTKESEVMKCFAICQKKKKGVSIFPQQSPPEDIL